MSNSNDIATHAAFATKITEQVLARGLQPGQCYAVHNVLGEREGYMPLVDGDDVMTDPAKAKAVVDALALTHAHRIQAPRLCVVDADQARGWLRTYTPGA